tara:strand:- start:99 stop:383 length:285 start_codon:yes stop_codon:yes gene_type:complete
MKKFYNEKPIDSHITCPYCDGEGAITNLGYYLQTLRKQAQLTQREMGTYAGYSRTQIQGVERGLRNPSPALLTSYQKLPISQALKLPVKILFPR